VLRIITVNLRIVPYDVAAADVLLVRSACGGRLVQQADSIHEDAHTWKVATKRMPSDTEREALAFAWRVCKHVRSNAIVFAQAHASLGIGAGQMSRVDAVRIAVEKTGARSPEVAASDAFFPFRDGLDLIAQAGVRAVVQPGGSVRDNEVIAAADEHDMAMLFTGVRHFKH
jgi:phosphoribosylaminoimidazolecarboxamide formyltransferase / IMP cyclohydrolase